MTIKPDRKQAKRSVKQSADASHQKTSAKLKVKDLKNTKSLLRNQGGKVQTSVCRACYLKCHGGK